MTSRRSSGSIRAESAVDPTRSENITVTWRRSAVSRAFGSFALSVFGASGGAPGKLCDSRQHYPPMPEEDADVLEVLIGQMTERGDTNAVLSEALPVLPETELLKPIRNLLHCGAPLRRWLPCPVQG
jgi:hypothetical protein